MSRFYLTGVNSRGNTISAAGASRGQDCHLRGWNAGVEVVAAPKPADPKRDHFVIFATSGSNGSRSRRELGRLIQMTDGRVCFQLADELAEAYDADFQTADIFAA